MSRSIHLSFLGIFFVAILTLLLAGFRPLGLPFQPEALFSDAVVSHFGAAYHLQASIGAGEYPLWNDILLGGQPFAANPLNKTAYPLQWLAVVFSTVLGVSPSAAIVHLNLLLIGHVALAAVGMWRWSRAVGLRPEAAALSTLAYAFAPRIIGHLGAGHLDIVYAMAWLPWLLERLHLRVGERYTVSRALWLAFVGAMLVLADVRVGLFAGLFSAVYALRQLVVRRNPHGLAYLALALVVFLPLVAALVVPLWGWGPYLSRSSLTAADVGGNSVSLVGFVGLLLPAHQGSIETTVYLGLGVMVLALVGWASRPLGERLFWGGVTVVFALWAAGPNTPFWSALAQLDALRWFRVPGRAWLILALTSALLAGYGLQTLMETADRWNHRNADKDDIPKVVFWLRLLAAATAGLFAFCGGTLLLADIAEQPASVGVTLLFNSVALGAVLMIVLLRRGQSRWVAMSLLLIVWADLAVNTAMRVEWRGTDDWLSPYTGLTDALIADNVGRVYSASYALPQQAAIVADVPLFYGVDPFHMSGTVTAIEAASNVPVTAYSVILPPIESDEDDVSEETDDTDSEPDISLANEGIAPNLEELARWDVSHIVAAYTYDLPDLTYIDTVSGINVYRNEIYVSGEFDPSLDDYTDLFPMETDIQALHQQTIASVWVSAVSFMILSIALTILSVRERRHDDRP